MGKERRGNLAPLAPRLRGPLTELDPTGLEPHGEWNDALVTGADLVGGAGDRFEIAGCELRDVRLTGADLTHARLVDVLAHDTELSGVTVHAASIVRVELHRCRMTGIVLSESKLTDVRLVGCKLDDANLRFLTAERIVFDGCSLVGADLTRATLTDATFHDCELGRARFTEASARGTRLVGSRLDGILGTDGLAGVVIAADQVLPLALSTFADRGIVVEHPEE